MDTNFDKIIQTCEWLNEHFDFGNRALHIEGRSAQEVADALSTMNIAMGTLQSLAGHLLNEIEIVLPEEEAAADGAEAKEPVAAGGGR